MPKVIYSSGDGKFISEAEFKRRQFDYSFTGRAILQPDGEDWRSQYIEGYERGKQDRKMTSRRNAQPDNRYMEYTPAWYGYTDRFEGRNQGHSTVRFGKSF